MSEMLEKARKYEDEQGKQIKAEDRPAFHVSPYVGWMNDPNGFSYYQGEYHLFYQYNPYDTHWDSMHWGHVVSKDLLHWEYLPAALAPDEDYDKIGCFSGSAIELDDGIQLLMYTAVDHETLEDGSKRDIQTQAVAVGDGRDYVKYEKNPVLTEKDLPEGASKVDFRDPKIWKEKDGYFYCVIGSRPADGSGQILLYRSANGFDWEFVSILAENKKRFGKMWECPDFFRLDGAQVLSFSPQGVETQDWKYENIYQSGYCLLDGALEGDYTLSEFQEYDHGFDFYAPQTYEDESGRRILIGWMGMPDSDYAYPEKEYQWTQMLTIPRELHVRNGRVYQQPVAELRTLRRTAAHQTVAGTAAFPAAPAWELEVQCSGAAPLEIRFGGDARFRWADGMCRLELGKSGCGRTLRRMPLGTLEQVQIFRDASSVEIFLNGGEAVFSTRFYPADDRLEITAAQAEATRWTLAAMEIRKDGES